MVQSVVLLGTADELSSYRALKVKVAAAYASLPLTVRTVEDVPGLGRMALQLGESSSSCLGNSASNVLRVVASLAPAAGLQASSHIGTAHVNSWMQFAVTDLEVPLAALGAKAKSVLVPALLILQRHLQHATFLVGNALTNADIALACVLHHAASVQAWDSSSTDESTSNVVRWYNTIVHQDCFITALQPPKSPSSPSPTATTEMVKGEQRLHGVAPPVVSKLYKRHRVRIKEVLAQGGANYLNQTITVGGWAKTTRNANKKAILFVELNDGSTGHGLQCVLNVESTTSGFEECQNSGGTGASFSFTGKCVESQGDEQAVELQVETATLLGAVMGGNLEGTAVGGAYYPIPKKNLTLEQLRLQAHLRARTKLHAAAMRVRHAMAYATHKFFHDHGFLYIHTPILTCADCEGAGEQFGVTTLMGADHTKPGVSLPTHQAPEAPAEGEVKKMSKKEQKRLAKKEQANKQKEESNKPTEEKIIGAVDYGKDFFGRRANLTVSGQLNVETHACALSDVYTFGPTFRAENSHTARHLSEFWMIEPEIAFSNLTDDINLAEDYLKYCVEYALAMCSDDLEFFEGNPFGEVGLRDRLRNVLDNPFKRLTYTEAIEVLQKAVEEDGIVFEEKPVWGIDLPSEHERYLCEKVYKMPVVLTDYPKEIKAFYMKLNPDGKTVAAADILVPKIGEIIGGSQREHDLETLKQRCIESGLDPKAVWWYLDLRKYGTVPHAGFGLGFERLILFITGLDNIRDVIPFPRWAGNAEF